MPFAQIPQLSLVSEQFAYDSTDPSFGAPAPEGTLRTVKHPTYGTQIYRMTLVEVSGGAAAGLLLKLGASTKTGVKVAALTLAADAAVQNIQYAGVTQAAVSEDYWAWLLVHGVGIANVSTASAASVPLYAIASGILDDASAGASTVHVGMTLGTGTGAGTAVLINCLA